MKTLNLNSKEFESLERFIIPEGLARGVTSLYFITIKGITYLIKIKYGCGYPEEKLLDLINKYKNKIGIEYLIYPEMHFAKNKIRQGYLMEFLPDATNFEQVFYDSNFPMDRKLKYLKQIGEILRKTDQFSKSSIPFFIGDLHEGNCLINPKDDHIYIIDLDSSTLGKHHSLVSKYMALNLGVDNLSKYPISISYGLNYQNKNTDLLCYNLMILNCIAQGRLNKLPLSDFYGYLNYLRSKGLSYELLDCFSILYSEGDNKSPEKLLDEILFSKEDLSLNGYKKSAFY